MTPIVIAALAGAGLLLVLSSSDSGTLKEINLGDRAYRIYTLKNGYKVVREYQGKDAVSITATGSGQDFSYHIWVDPQLQPELIRRIRIESARDIMKDWQIMGLPPQLQVELPGEYGSIA